MNLQPQEVFTISRQLDDSQDPTTYYVQAVVRDLYHDTILATVNLSSKGGQRYTAQYPVPSDPGGQGFWISITTKVYTDSGHTTLSPAYSTVEDDYLVQTRFSPSFGYGGSSISYDTIREIVKKELKKIEFPEQNDFGIPKIHDSIKEISSSIKGLDNSKQIDEIKSSLGDSVSKQDHQKSIDSINSSISGLSDKIMKEILDKIKEVDLGRDRKMEVSRNMMLNDVKTITTGVISELRGTITGMVKLTITDEVKKVLEESVSKINKTLTNNSDSNNKLNDLYKTLGVEKPNKINIGSGHENLRKSMGL